MDILRRSPSVDVDADEGRAFTVGVRGGVVALPGVTRFSGVWFVFLLILQVSCRISGEK